MKRVSAILSGLFLFFAVQVSAKTITIYHTTDVHGWYSARPARWNKDNPARAIGGFPALAALLVKEKNPYILLDGGDMFQGTPEGALTKGMASVTLMNQLGYRAAVVGNHDYDYSEDNLKVLISSAAFPFLGANVSYKADAKPASYLKPYVIIEKDGEKIAVLGIAGKHTATSTLPSNVKHLAFGDEAAETAKWIGEIKRQKPDAIVVLAHVGISDDLALKTVDVSTLTLKAAPHSTLALARAAKGINLVFGAHNHTGLLKGYYDKESGVWLGESGTELAYVTKADLTFDDKTGKLSGIKVALLPLWTDETGEDPLVLKTIAGYSAAVEREMGKVLGRADTDLGFGADGLDSDIGNWLCDATRAQAGTELAFQNTAGIRAEIKRGEIKLRDLYQVMPFDNTIVTLRMTGSQIKSLMTYNLHDGSRSAMQISGLTVEFKKGTDGKVTDIRLKKDGREIKPDEEFFVATNNYLAFGGSGGREFTKGKDIKDTMVNVRDAMAQYLAASPVAKAPARGRIKRLD